MDGQSEVKEQKQRKRVRTYVESDLPGSFISRLVTRAALDVLDERACLLPLPLLWENYPSIQIVVAFRAAGRKLQLVVTLHSTDSILTWSWRSDYGLATVQKLEILDLDLVYVMALRNFMSDYTAFLFFLSLSSFLFFWQKIRRCWNCEVT